MIEENLFSRNDLYEYMQGYQVQLVFKKIIEAAKNLKTEVYFNTDIKLSAKCLSQLSKLGYNANESFKKIESKDKLNPSFIYTYHISWN